MPKRAQQQKPLVFVGSSGEGLAVAQAIQSNLEPRHARVNVWRPNEFKPGDILIDSLLQQVKSCDFGVFICAADDLVTRRGKKYKTARDNVIFELGLFMGRLGRQRAFIVVPEGVEVVLPSDLNGVNKVSFDGKRKDNLTAALANACNRIARVIETLGCFREGLAEQVLTVAEPVERPAPFKRTKN